MKNVVSVIIPNWNGKHLLKACLSSLEEQTFKGFEVIIIDNGSTDGSVDYVRETFPNFKVVKFNKNIGFAPAINAGIRNSTGKYIVLLNNDTKIDKNCLRYLVRAADKHNDVGMIAAKMLNFYNPDLIDSAGDYIDAVGHANNIGLGEKNDERFSKAGYVFLVTGGGALFKRQVFERVGLFDEDYFAYFEDVDLCLRAQFMGFKGWYESKAIIYHIHKATSNKNRALTEYLQFRNMTMTVIKDFPTPLLLRDCNWLKIILVNLNTIRFLASCGYLIPAIKAESYIMFHLFDLLRKRNKIQSDLKVPISYVINNVKPKKITFFGLFK